MGYAPNVPQPRRSLVLPLMAAAVLGAGVATATFALVNIEDAPVVSLPTPAEESAAVPSGAVAGQRPDGGPEEGIAQQSIEVQPASASTAAGIRYDGGPEEGMSGAVTAGHPSTAAAAAGIRYDGGPEEGTQGTATAQQSNADESGPVPCCGMRP
jgi:hypothetical protein